MNSEDEDGDEDEIVDWTVLKSIQAANGASSAAQTASNVQTVSVSAEQLELAAAEIESNASVGAR
jgi:hypothetical protein